MNNINVLVTGIGGPIAQGVIQGLKKRDDVTIIGADRRSVTAGHHFCDHAYKVPRYSDKKAYLNALKDIEKNEAIDIIFPSLHEEVLIFDEHRNDFDALIAIPTSDNFPLLMDKESTYQKMEEEGLSKFVPVYKSFNSSDELKQIKNNLFKEESKFVVKSVDSYASVGFAVLTNKENYIKAIRNGWKNIISLDDYYEANLSGERKIAMEYFSGKEYSIDVMVHNKKMITAVPRERNGVSNNIVLDGKVVYHEKLIEAAKEITEKLINSGFINIQFMESDGEYKLTDINPRFCGSQVMSLGAGVNFPSLFIEYNFLFNHPAVNPVWNVRMLRFRDQIFINEE